MSSTTGLYVHTMPQSLSSMILYWPDGDDALSVGRYSLTANLETVTAAYRLQTGINSSLNSYVDYKTSYWNCKTCYATRGVISIR